MGYERTGSSSWVGHLPTHVGGKRGGRLHELRWLLLAGLLAGILAVPAPSQGQYFGQNQVRWDQFDFQVLETERFLLYHYPHHDAAIQDAARMAERWYERIARSFGFDLRERNPLILYADHPDFQQTNVIEGRIGEGTGGVTEGFRQRVIMPLTESNADTEQVLGHELVHVFQFELATRPGGPGLRAMMSQPLWSVEGLAEYLSLGRAHTHTEMWLRDAILRDDFPTLRDLTMRPRDYFPYRFGHAFWAYVGGRWDDEVAMRLFARSLQRGIDPALDDVLGTGPDSLSIQWERSVRAALEPRIDGRLPPEDVGRPILTEKTTGGRLNVVPSLSPDGSRLAFLSERGLFSIDLFLADVETGEVIRRLVSTETDPHFDALAFIQSSGTWSPDGERFAFVVFTRGENRLVIIDADTGRREREIAAEGVGAITHPSWSPDGSRLAFSGQSGGRSNLWTVDVESGETRMLTDDAYSALQPAWSPDGRTVAFATDRGPHTDLDRLHFGPLRLALVDVATGSVREVPVFPTGKAINPTFSADGESLYFIADPDGFSDIYRLGFETGDIFRVTRVATGVSGITGRSPALTVATRQGRLAFSLFSGGGYSVHTLTAAEAAGNRVAPARLAVAVPGALPPIDRARKGFIMRYLADPELGLPPPPVQPARPYRARLGLEMLGPVTIGVGADRFGTFAGGGVSAMFTDMLRDRILQVTVQGEGELQNIGGQVLYLNRERRWTWGLSAGRIPYRTGVTFLQPGPLPGDEVVTQLIQRVTAHQASALAQYPFSRIRRAEFSAGVTHLGFDVELWRWTLRAGRVVDVTRDRPPPDQIPESLNLFQGSVALVEDNSVLGFISPIRGQRWRLELQPTLGSLDYVTALADFRRYLSGRPITVALRTMHLGRYGPDAEDRRLSPLFLGFETFVRGYAFHTFDPRECTRSPDQVTQGCPEFDRLFGSRLAVANLELRVPIFGIEGLALFGRGPLPIDLASFVDAGTAWNSEEPPELTWATRSTERIPVMSAGIATRIGLGQFFALEIFYVYPFQRPERGAHFGFQIAPGW